MKLLRTRAEAVELGHELLAAKLRRGQGHVLGYRKERDIGKDIACRWMFIAQQVEQLLEPLDVGPRHPISRSFDGTLSDHPSIPRSGLALRDRHIYPLRWHNAHRGQRVTQQHKGVQGILAAVAMGK